MIPQALTLLAADPRGLGGAVLHGPAGPERDAWLEQFLRDLAPAGPVRRVPLSITPDRLLGGLDLTATIAAGRPVMQPGILHGTEDGVVIVPSAERLSDTVIAALTALLDGPRPPVVIALDESEADEPAVAPALAQRLAFHVALGTEQLSLRGRDSGRGNLATSSKEPLSLRGGEARMSLRGRASGRGNLATPSKEPCHHEGAQRPRDLNLDAAPESTPLPRHPAEFLCEAALALGVIGSRADTFALRAALAHASLHGRDLTEDDLVIATELVLAPRATRIPVVDAPPPPPPDQSATNPGSETEATDPGELADRLVEAARAFLPPSLLQGAMPPSRHAAGGRGDSDAASDRHGRRVGTRRGDPRTGARLDLIETLRAAAPWQRARPAARTGRLAVRKDDFRIQRLRRRTGTTVVFAVDASGSQALHRLAETKGAVELLLADSYVRRDRVALIAFRGTTAEEVLPPTRSLARARRTLTALAGGGGTPLAAALLAARRLADRIARERNAGNTLLVLLTDGRANVALDGTGGRARAEADGIAAARSIRAARIPAVLIDTSPRPSPQVAQLAAAMDARLVPLPVVDAHGISGTVQRAIAASR